MNEIVLKQAPVIGHQLITAGQLVQKRIDSLSVETLVATEDTLQSIKKLRAELNRELEDYEAQRKLIKQAVNAPYLEFEFLYKSEITDRYNRALAILKDGAVSVEVMLRDKKKAGLKEYFEEACEVLDLGFVKFDMYLEKHPVLLSVSDNKNRAAIDMYLNQIRENLIAAESMANAIEIITEYKNTLDFSRSIQQVMDRLKREEKERDFSTRAIKSPVVSCANILPPPVEEQKKMATFKVYGTVCQLKELGEYMRTNMIEYLNI